MEMTLPLPIPGEVYRLDRIVWTRNSGVLRSQCGRFSVLCRTPNRWLLYDHGQPVTRSGVRDDNPHEFARQRDAREHAAYITTGERLHIAGLIRDPLRW